MVLCIKSSVSRSTAAVASSSIKILVFFNSVLAKHTSCRCPTLKYGRNTSTNSGNKNVNLPINFKRLQSKVTSSSNVILILHHLENIHTILNHLKIPNSISICNQAVSHFSFIFILLSSLK